MWHNTTMRRIVLIFVGFFLFEPSFGQTTRSLSGNVVIDVGTIDRDLNIELTVSNHSFVVLPTFTIIRPITSQRSTTVQLPAGQTSAAFIIDEIILDPVDYSIRIDCLSCRDSITLQYVAEPQNLTVLAGDAFLDPDQLPAEIEIELLSRAQFSGSIALFNDQLAADDLQFEVTAIAPQQNDRVLQSSRLVLTQGQNQVGFVLRDIDRNIPGGVQILARCLGCIGVFPGVQRLSQTFDPASDQQNILVQFNGDFQPLIAPAIYLLLEEDD